MKITQDVYGPCACGSGKKYKFCCQTRDRQAAHDKRREEMAAWEAPPEELDDDDESGQGHRGHAAKMMEFAQVLIDPENPSLEATRTALDFAMVCWNLAISSPGKEPEERVIDGLVESMHPESDEKRVELKDLLILMVKRHLEMFPEEHARVLRNRGRSGN